MRRTICYVVTTILITIAALKIVGVSLFGFLAGVGVAILLFFLLGVFDITLILHWLAGSHGLNEEQSKGHQVDQSGKDT
mgnify:CR=1 FL=1